MGGDTGVHRKIQTGIEQQTQPHILQNVSSIYFRIENGSRLTGAAQRCRVGPKTNVMTLGHLLKSILFEPFISSPHRY